MHRFTVSIDDRLAQKFDRFAASQGYGNRSEAVRDLIRRALEQESAASGTPHHCVGALSYVYNHHERQLAGRLTELHHELHHLSVATMHAHLDHENCLEVTILQGPMHEVVALANAVKAQPGVRHGNFQPISVHPVAQAISPHAHCTPLT